MKRRPWLWLVVLAVLAVAAVAIAGPGRASDAGPQGTLALRRFLTGMGRTVRSGDNPAPGASVFVLFNDLRSTEQADSLLGWARDGGTLVVADPRSAVLSEAGIHPAGNVGHYSFGPPTVAPACVAPETVGVKTVAIDAGDALLATAGAGAAACFPLSSGAFEISEPMGSGRLVALGGMSPFTNALLSHAGNARFALGLLGSPGPGDGGTVVFGSPAPPGAVPPGLWKTLPPAARVALLEAGLALLAFALYRARRFGRPVPEHLPAPVPASELVDAVGRLYRSARATGFAGDTMRAFTLRRLRTRVAGGAGPGPADAEAISSALSGLTGRDPEAVRRLVAGPAPVSDDELINLGRGLEELRQQVEDSWV